MSLESKHFGRIAWLIVGIALLFRLGGLSTVRHGYDQAFQAFQALQLLDGGQILTVGQPSSVFVDNPPLMAYLQAGVLFFWRSIWAVYIFVAALNGLATWFVYDATRQLYDGRTALIAAFLFAVNPWLVHFSRMPWTQGLLPFFMAVMAWGLWPTLAIGEPQKKRFFLGLLAAVAMMQSYILAFVIVAPLGLIFLLLYRRVPKKPLIGGIVVFVVTFGLFLAGLSRSADVASSQFSDFMSNIKLGFEPAAISHAVRYVTGVNWSGQDVIANAILAPTLISQVSDWVLLLAMVVGGLLAVWGLRHSAERPRALTMLIWFAVPTVGLALIPFLLHPHYLLLTVPVGHVFAADALSRISKSRVIGRLVVVMLIVFGVQFGLNLQKNGAAVASNPYWPDFTHWQLSEAAKVGDTIAGLTADQDTPIRVAAPGHPAIITSAVARQLDASTGAVYPNYLLIPESVPMHYVIQESLVGRPYLTEVIEALPNDLLSEQRNRGLHILRTVPHSAESARQLPTVAVDWTSDAGWNFLGYDVKPEAEQLVVTTWWRVEGLAEPRAEWFVTTNYQLFDAEMQPRANVGAHGMWGYKWQMGDLIVEQMGVPISAEWPSGDYALRIGLYDPIHNINFNLNGPTGPQQQFNIDVPINK